MKTEWGENLDVCSGTGTEQNRQRGDFLQSVPHDRDVFTHTGGGRGNVFGSYDNISTVSFQRKVDRF